MPGLRFKAWISDEATDRWGAVYVWESREAAEQELPSRARELIGKEPAVAEELLTGSSSFDLSPYRLERFAGDAVFPETLVL